MGDIELQVFADRIKELRIKNKLTQTQFIDGLGITASALSAYEKNIKNPSISVAKRIAEKYKVSIDWLCGLSDTPSTNGDLTNYSDVILSLVAIERKIKITCDSTRIMVYNKKLSKFLGNWKNMINLHSSGTIDDNLYNLWLEQQISLYDCKILSKDGALEVSSTDTDMVSD